MSTVYIKVVDEVERPIAYLHVDVLPRPGERLRFEGAERIAHHAKDRAPTLASSYMVERISSLARVSDIVEPSGSEGPVSYGGTARTIVHVRAESKQEEE